MAVINCSYSGGGFTTSLYASGYSNGATMTINGVTYDTSTGKYSISYTAKLYDVTGDSGRYNNTARYVSLGGQQQLFETNTLSWSAWSNGTVIKSGTYTTTSTSVSTYIKVMFNYGYTNARWNANTGCVDGSGTITITPAAYTVSYAANGGSSTPGNQTKYYNTNLTLAGAISRNNSTANGYTVTFNANGGSVSPTTKTATDTTSYSFSSWKASNGTIYSGGGTYTANAGTTMTAQWSSSTSKGAITTPTATRANGTATARTVTFNATSNGGTCSTASSNSTATITYTGNGWYTATSSGTKRCANGGSYTPSSAETLYQQWGSSTGSYSAVTLPSASKANGSSSRTVTFNANGGTCSTTSLNSTATVTYSCSGWYTAASGGTKRGAVGGTYTPSASETVYAQFSSSTGSYSAINLPTPTRTGYIFKGWAESSTATSGVTGSYTPSQSLTLYATWVEDQPTVWVKNSSGTWVKGKVWYKNSSGTWVKAKKFYVKSNGAWVENKTTP